LTAFNHIHATENGRILANQAMVGVALCWRCFENKENVEKVQPQTLPRVKPPETSKLRPSRHNLF
jgi:hypothetical protein